jgi:hypothetical protein
MKEFKNVFLNQLLTRIKTVAHHRLISHEGRWEGEVESGEWRLKWGASR